jgi:predicted nucleic acid-binding protein
LIVVDASVLVPALADPDSDGDTARSRLLVEPELHAPYHLDLEVVSSLRRRLQTGSIDRSRADEALSNLEILIVRRHPFGTLLDRIWSLRENVTPYDAAYIALAEALDVPLVTADRRLARTPGVHCSIELLT